MYMLLASFFLPSHLSFKNMYIYFDEQDNMTDKELHVLRK